MKSYIKDIVIFNKNGEKRVVPLEQGVNIITGESKTGKSALVEIIDYCLCSTRCTIPKGKITEFAYLYSLVMAIGDNTYVIARYNWNDGGKMHFIKEKEDFELEKLELSYFMEKSQLLCKDVKDEIEYALGLLITNMAKDAEQQGKKASLRNMVSYLFQHQNLMASKFALFYRFSDFYKRKDVIDQFPVFAGMISQEYYSDLIQLNTLKDQLKQKYKKQKANEKSTAYIKERLSTLLLSCHIALFLSFLHYFAGQENSPMLLTMFFDQPSQVYFPQGDDKNDVITQADLKAVNKMYTTIFDEMKLIEKETGILPQIIIVDHVDGNNLECKGEFNEYVRCNWRNGKALI